MDFNTFLEMERKMELKNKQDQQTQRINLNEKSQLQHYEIVNIQNQSENNQKRTRTRKTDTGLKSLSLMCNEFDKINNPKLKKKYIEKHSKSFLNLSDNDKAEMINYFSNGLTQ